MHFYSLPYSLLYIFNIIPVKKLPDNCVLTFDDGPDPKSTPEILNILDELDLKAMFFCTGENIRLYPELAAEIKRRGHSIGNHGFNHSNAFKLPAKYFYKNVYKGFIYSGSNYFRPPYGFIWPWQATLLKKRKTNLVLWKFMPGDFKPEINPKQYISLIKKALVTKQIIVLHDSLNGLNHLRKYLETIKALPK